MYKPELAMCVTCGTQYLKTTPIAKYCKACAKKAKRARDIKSDERVKARRGK
jgi:hypothetical protein